MTGIGSPLGILLEGSPMLKNILVIAAHPDDEVLGCGGTIARHAADGDSVHCLFISDGVSARPDYSPTELLTRHAASASTALILGVTANYHLGYADNRLDAIPLIDIVQSVEQIVKKLQPNIIYTHHHGDLNIDHRITCEAALTACRPTPGSSVQSIFSFEIMSSTEWALPQAEPFLPDHYVEITAHLQQKMAALQAYEEEMRESPHSRSISHLKALAIHRGHSVGLHAAEAYQTIRTLVRG